MLRLRIGFWMVFAAIVCGFVILASGSSLLSNPALKLTLGESRSAPSDLEVGGDLAGLPSGSTRYVTTTDLRKLPQVSYTVTDDTNFTGPTKVSGVALSELPRSLGASPSADLIVAICDDKYRANYTRTYIAAHQPLLVLEINGQPASGKPKDARGRGYDVGPFLISHPEFVPSYSVLSHSEMAMIPWGVVRVEFRSAAKIFGSIAPRGPHANDDDVQAGFKLARQNCFRCHNSGNAGGEKAGIPWGTLGALAAKSPKLFTAYVRTPEKMNPQTRMEGSPEYEDATMKALIAYFSTFEGTVR
jgi:mono/diheme cytochrome c family protein